jgi:hypothetical protein
MYIACPESKDEEVKKMVNDWFCGLVADFYDAGSQKLVMAIMW